MTGIKRVRNAEPFLNKYLQYCVAIFIGTAFFLVNRTELVAIFQTDLVLGIATSVAGLSLLVLSLIYIHVNHKELSALSALFADWELKSSSFLALLLGAFIAISFGAALAFFIRPGIFGIAMAVLGYFDALGDSIYNSRFADMVYRGLQSGKQLSAKQVAWCKYLLGNPHVSRDLAFSSVYFAVALLSVLNLKWQSRAVDITILGLCTVTIWAGELVLVRWRRNLASDLG